MIKVLYNELDGPEGVTLRLEAAGHAGYAPAGQDIVCAGASTLMQALVSLLAGEESTRSDAWDEPDGPRLAVVADAPQKPWVEGAFELAKTGFALLAERYPDNLRFADVSRRGERGMMDLQLFAEGGEGAAPALSAAQTQQAIASGTMKPGSAKADEAAPPAPEEAAEETGGEGGESESKPQPEPPRPPLPERFPGREVVDGLHSRWAAEEALMRRVVPEFSLKEELRNPEMRRLMQLPGMRMADAYRLAHYNDALRQAAHDVEQGVVERIRQRAARPAENGTRPGSAAVTGADASGTMKPGSAKADEAAPPAPEEAAEETGGEGGESESKPQPEPPRPPLPERFPGREVVDGLHSRWAAEEALMRRVVPEFSLKEELRNPEMRRLMQLPGMRMADAYRLAHYNDALRQAAHDVEQGVVERIRQRAARPAENGTRPGSAAVTGADVSRMSRAQREALERKALHGERIVF